MYLTGDNTMECESGVNAERMERRQDPRGKGNEGSSSGCVRRPRRAPRPGSRPCGTGRSEQHESGWEAFPVEGPQS